MSYLHHKTTMEEIESIIGSQQAKMGQKYDTA